MGFAHALVAVRDLSPDEAAARLGRSLSGEVTDLETATTRETPGWCVSPPIDGWTFLVDKDTDLYVIGDPPPFGEPVSGFREGPGVVAGLDMATAPPPEMWEELGFDGSARPSARAAALGLAVRQAEPAEGTSYHQPVVQIFARLTGHTYDHVGALDDVELQVLGPALAARGEGVR